MSTPSLAPSLCASLDEIKGEVSRFLRVPLPEDFTAPNEASPVFLNQRNLHTLVIERPPFLMPNKAVMLFGEEEKVVWAVARMTEKRCEGHFPERPIVPLIRLCECLAQTGMFLVASQGDSKTHSPVASAAGASRAFIKDFLDAPVTLLLRVELVKTRHGFYFAKGTAYADGKKVGTLMDIRYSLVPRSTMVRKVKKPEAIPAE